MKTSTIFIALCTALTFSACDYVTNPLEDGNGGVDPGDTTTVLRKVLLEDFTGHYCTNCPEAALTAEQLSQVYGDLLVVVGVHAGPAFFVEPQTNPDGSYATDFRTDAGNDYAQAFSINSLPKGMVSRREFNGSITLSDGSWGSATAEIIGEEAIFDIKFANVQYDQGNNQISADLVVEALDDVTGDYSCVIYLLEDHVVDWQLSSLANPPDVPDYDHRHVLRDNLNSTWGTSVFSTSAVSGETADVNVANFALNPDWDMDNGYLVAWVYDENTSEVFQVEEYEITP